MDSGIWIILTAALMALLVAFLKWRQWQKASDARCCGGRCGCRVSRQKKKRAAEKEQADS